MHALDYGLSRLNEMPLSLRLLREMHAILLESVRGDQFRAGEFRGDQNWIGPAGCGLFEATFVPPPPMELSAALDQFEKYLHQPSELPPLARLAAIHHQFEAIHPFHDGNGRIGRLLITLLRQVEGLLPSPLLYLSAYLERHRDDYYRHLLAVSQAGAWNAWLAFLLQGVAEQAQDAMQRAAQLQDLQKEFTARCQAPGVSTLLPRLVRQLFSQPVLTVARAATLLDVTPRSASLHIERLVELNILPEATGQKRNRVFVADRILAAAEEPITVVT